MNLLVRKGIKRLAYSGCLNWLPDKIYLKILFRAHLNKKLDLKNPKTFNEKLQWLKLYDHNPIYTTMVDKYEVKRYVAKLLGEEYVIPTLGVWNHFDEIDFDILPDQFVLKCTHDSGGLVICKDKSKFDKASAKKKIEKSLKTNYYWSGREWPYKNVKPRIIAEKYMEDSDSQELTDYKIFTFDSIVKALFIVSGRQEGETKADYFDAEFNHLDFTWGYPNADICPTKPKTFDFMVNAAEKLAKDTSELRVDFYEVNGKAYFGELTFFDGSGFDEFNPGVWDEKFGTWIKLPKIYEGGRIDC
ncbi:ATP-grasp fold amidoligase family protein [Lacrimispora sp.]|uniref:ATP-grasp fold amidoligase family protein n=1 Tax=Lacrimispora sp. TaxID=2719234 RepID=UPI0028AB3E5A|nr:ATP-grasp fold amidoligase family protein [Lacrimispora sp.]